MSLRPSAVISGAVILGVVAVLVGLWLTWSPVERAIPDAGSPVTATSVDEFRAGFLPLLEQAAADAQVLVTLGESRERNLLRIHTEQEAMAGSLAAADAWLAAQQPPTSDEPAIVAYRHGAAAIRKAMSEAEAGFLRFDFDRVARATGTLNSGSADLTRAVSLLQEK